MVDNLGITTLAEAADWERLAVLREDRNAIAHCGSVRNPSGRPAGADEN
jgi:hypothetical protein